MIELLKGMVMKHLASKLMGGSMNEAISGAVASQGAGAFVSMIQEKLTGGGLGDLTSMLSGEGSGADMISGFQDKLGGIMQEQGVSAEEATSQAGSIAPGIFSMVQEKFASTDEADAGFDLSALAGLAGGGNVGDMLGGAADMLKGNAGDILGKATNLFK